MISHIHKCIFIHIPKCGGTSIENVIWPEPRKEEDLWMGFISKYYNKYQTGGLQHLFASHVLQEAGEEVFAKYFKFTIVRNPWEKAISQYFYMGRRPDLRDFIGMQENVSFKYYLDLIRKKTHVQWEPQYQFITDSNGELIVDYVGRLESINKDMDVIFNRIGIKATIEHTNATKHQHYSHYYDDESREMVSELYSSDIRMLGYAFESGI